MVPGDDTALTNLIPCLQDFVLVLGVDAHQGQGHSPSAYGVPGRIRGHVVLFLPLRYAGVLLKEQVRTQTLVVLLGGGDALAGSGVHAEDVAGHARVFLRGHLTSHHLPETLQVVFHPGGGIFHSLCPTGCISQLLSLLELHQVVEEERVGLCWRVRQELFSLRHLVHHKNLHRNHVLCQEASAERHGAQ